MWAIDDAEILAQAKTLLLQEMLRRGVLVLNTHEVTTAHTDEDIEVVAAAYAESLSIVSDGLDRGSLLDRLDCEPIRPLFRVR
jgi:glutamate-1-semialdehyde 2,1-aminomutase